MGASLQDRALAVPVEPASSLAPTGFDPSRSIYRSQDYAMCTIEQGRDPDGAPLSEVWTFAGEDDYVEGYGHLIVRVQEVVETKHSGTLAVYYRQWVAPDGEPAWGKRPLRRVGSLGSLKALIRRRKMQPCDSDRSGEAVETTGSTEGESAGPEGIARKDQP